MEHHHHKIQNCGLCNVPITTGSFTVLECKHSYHAKCAHGPLTRGYARCILCEKNTRNNSVADSEYRSLDFGDDWILSNDRRAYEETSNLICDIPGQVPLRVDLDRLSIALSLREQKNKDTNAFFGKLEVLGIRHETDLASLIKDKTPSGILVQEKNIDAQSLWRKGITLEQLMKAGYALKDLIVLKATWNDMLMLRFNHTVWGMYKKQLPVSEIITIYKITIHDVLHMCNYSMLSVASIQFSVKELESLKATMPLLIDMYLDKESMIMFGFSMEEWRAFGLTFDNLLQLQISRADLYEKTQSGYAGLGWVNIEHQQAKLQRFSTIFGKTPNLLPARSTSSPTLFYNEAGASHQNSMPSNEMYQSVGYPTLNTQSKPPEISQQQTNVFNIIANSIAENRPLTEHDHETIQPGIQRMFQGVNITKNAKEMMEFSMASLKSRISNGGWLAGPPRGIAPVRGPHAFFVVESENRSPQTFVLTTSKPLLLNVTPHSQNVLSYPTLS